jgi:EAL and modified HD-GYP domain-containing signal transduction protein
MTPLNVDSREILYVARQPILDAKGQVFGYELLYKDMGSDDAERRDDLADARVLTDAVVNLGLETITGGRPAFLNLTRPLLLRLPALLPAGAAIFELNRDIPVDGETFQTCEQLSNAGYALGLDGFELDADTAALLPFMKFVKVGAARDPDRLQAIARALSTSGIRLVANDVETEEAFEQARAAGYHLFQGRYFSQPTVCGGAAVPGRHLAYLNLLAALNRPDITLGEVEDLVKRDASLTYRVLRCINSAAFGLRCEVRSVRQALLLLGLAPIRSWASVWCVAGLNTGGVSELVTTVLIRGRCCELLAERLPDAANSSEMFLVGLCSMLDVMLRRPMSESIADLPLSQGARGALLGESNALRTLLDAVITYERADWETATSAIEALGLRGPDLAEAYTGSLRWSRELAVGP